MKNNKNNLVFILVPSKVPSGPIKGAFAIANGLVNTYQIKIIYLKKVKRVNSYLDPRVEEFLLSNKYGFIGKIIAYRNLIKSNKVNISISMCFSADLVNFFCRGITSTISSIRGNLPKNYYFDYGILGLFLAFIHLNLMRNFDSVLAMSNSMRKQIKKISKVESIIIRNFVDEIYLEKFRPKKIIQDQKLNIVFLGSLSKRKRPLLLIDILSEIKKENFSLNLVGDGPLNSKIKERIKKLDMGEKIIMHGFVDNPHKIVSKCDLLILPSFSEGISRAVLECLYLGLNCVVFDVDANSELSNKCNKLFVVKNKKELKEKILYLLKNNHDFNKRINLLPFEYSQKECISMLINVLKKYDLKYYN